jgi:triphosphoribosyl-dephospho-CoA synthase
MYDSNFIAGCAQLAMLLEVSANPKPGNVDREHDYKNLRYEHFLGSAVGTYAVFKKAASLQEYTIGGLMLEAVDASSTWQMGGNAHFGAILLLVPLCVAASISSDIEGVKKNVREVVKKTTVFDALQFYRAFSRVNVRVGKSEILDVWDPSSLDAIESENLTLFNIMEISTPNDTLAREWIEGFPLTFRGAQILLKRFESEHSLNDSIVYTFLSLLGEIPDTLIAKKFGKKIANEVSSMSKQALVSGKVAEFDEYLLDKNINPGTTADIIIGSLFITLLGGLRF